MINISVKNLRKAMTKNVDYKLWKNINTTNCFAFAMGLDIPEKSICRHAYCIGEIAISTGTKNYKEMPNYESEFRGDLEALGIEYETSNDSGLLCDIDRREGRYIDVLFFQDLRNVWDTDFHFARYGKDGKLYHKMGYDGIPCETSIKEIKKEGYTFTRRYRLFLIL